MHKRSRRIEYCKHETIQKCRNLAGDLIHKLLVGKGYGQQKVDKNTAQIVKWMYSNNKNTGEANRMKKDTTPASWKRAWEKVGQEENRTKEEISSGLGMEIAITLDGSMPVWSGIITKAFIALLNRGGMKQSDT